MAGHNSAYVVSPSSFNLMSQVAIALAPTAAGSYLYTSAFKRSHHFLHITLGSRRLQHVAMKLGERHWLGTFDAAGKSLQQALDDSSRMAFVIYDGVMHVRDVLLIHREVASTHSVVNERIRRFHHWTSSLRSAFAENIHTMKISIAYGKHRRQRYLLEDLHLDLPDYSCTELDKVLAVVKQWMKSFDAFVPELGMLIKFWTRIMDSMTLYLHQGDHAHMNFLVPLRREFLLASQSYMFDYMLATQPTIKHHPSHFPTTTRWLSDQIHSSASNMEQHWILTNTIPPRLTMPNVSSWYINSEKVHFDTLGLLVSKIRSHPKAQSITMAVSVDLIDVQKVSFNEYVIKIKISPSEKSSISQACRCTSMQVVCAFGDIHQGAQMPTVRYLFPDQQDTHHSSRDVQKTRALNLEPSFRDVTIGSMKNEKVVSYTSRAHGCIRAFKGESGSAVTWDFSENPVTKVGIEPFSVGVGLLVNSQDPRIKLSILVEAKYVCKYERFLHITHSDRDQTLIIDGFRKINLAILSLNIPEFISSAQTAQKYLEDCGTVPPTGARRD